MVRVRYETFVLGVISWDHSGLLLSHFMMDYCSLSSLTVAMNESAIGKHELLLTFPCCWVDAWCNRIFYSYFWELTKTLYTLNDVSIESSLPSTVQTQTIIINLVHGNHFKYLTFVVHQKVINIWNESPWNKKFSCLGVRTKLNPRKQWIQNTIFGV